MTPLAIAYDVEVDLVYDKENKLEWACRVTYSDGEREPYDYPFIVLNNFSHDKE